MPAPRTTAAARGTARPALSGREAQALRDALALRQALAARPDLTPEQAARLVAATRAKSAGARPPARRTSGSGRPAARRTPKRAAPRARRPAPARSKDRSKDSTGSPWSRRLGVVALSTLLLPAAAALGLPGTTDPAQDAGALDATSLALTAQTSLLEQADRYRELEQAVAQRQADLQAAREAANAAALHVTGHQEQVGAAAAALYTATPEDRYPLLGLDVRDGAASSAALQRAAHAEHADRELQVTVVRAQRSGVDRDRAADRVAAAEAAVAAAAAQADAVLAGVRTQVQELGPGVVGRLAALGTSPAAGAQQERNERAMLRWQTYLGVLDGAGIEPPPASALTDLTALPPGMSPALDSAGAPVPGVAWAVVGSSPVTVLPAETVAAVSSALSQLGKPYVPGTSGPDTYDCGGFTAASWLLAGYAIPATPQDQWATGVPVSTAGLQVGDLVVSPGGVDVGIYLGDGDVVGASAGSFQVGVHPMVAGSSAVRVPLGAAAEANAPLAGPAATAACGAALPVPGTVNPAWGGWSNGQIPGETLCALGVGRHALRCDAAAAYAQMSAAYEESFGRPICITDSYRSLASQVSAFTRKPRLAAVPGTSNHGWALAVDLCDGVNRSGSPQWTWMTQNAGRFGWVQPDWAAPGGEKPEPWHWEFGYIS